MNTPQNLLTLEAGGGCDILEIEDSSLPHEKAVNEEVTIISGTITVSP